MKKLQNKRNRQKTREAVSKWMRIVGLAEEMKSRYQAYGALLKSKSSDWGQKTVAMVSRYQTASEQFKGKLNDWFDNAEQAPEKSKERQSQIE